MKYTSLYFKTTVAIFPICAPSRVLGKSEDCYCCKPKNEAQCIDRGLCKRMQGNLGTCVNITSLPFQEVESKYILSSANPTYNGYSRPAEKFLVVTPQTPLKLLGQNLFGDHFWGRSEPGKVWPQAILGPRATPLSAP